MKKREKVRIEKAVAINDSFILTEGDEIIVLRDVDETAEDESLEEETKEAPKTNYKERFEQLRAKRREKK